MIIIVTYFRKKDWLLSNHGPITSTEDICPSPAGFACKTVY